ncbi:hypothetical protein B9Z55_027221 [Caenorhabditis nigoni]|uniref:Uncharacterized protein n=1 Tax=Caenorhabditis nigoni TaxID=1611254 RepID=A0A2G5SGQ4_9PELO|nr:hypothetical protein B9Z55_027221 [Caenorhabditis nigoni]
MRFLVTKAELEEKVIKMTNTEQVFWYAEWFLQEQKRKIMINNAREISLKSVPDCSARLHPPPYIRRVVHRPPTQNQTTHRYTVVKSSQGVVKHIPTVNL